MLPPLLSRAGGPAVATAEALKGKIVALYFSAAWCPACQRFSPLMRQLYDDAALQKLPLEVVFVSSDRSAQEMQSYMDDKHGSWLSVPFECPERSTLKQRYGCFAGAEKSNFPGVDRLSGIPALVIINQDGEKLQLLDCDEGPSLSALKTKGVEVFKEWASYAWK
ncbi:hypothetical protein AB1Y20_020580 [Prymnesium parvum]|uniref:Thioredoxin domain-containing protein n=1 Tax=Prymnesium parvum TaxID=97485 RepID=A0AB34JYF8_PRYPA